MSGPKAQLTQVCMDASLPAVDTAQLSQIVDSPDPRALRELAAALFAIFVEESSRSLNRLEAVCQARDAVVLADIVHAISGSAGNLGLVRLRQYLQDLERLLKAGRFSEYALAAGVIREAVECGWRDCREIYGLD
jgi:HPt (histidine-containing phosphotransfer) domain-containing protein